MEVLSSVVQPSVPRAAKGVKEANDSRRNIHHDESPVLIMNIDRDKEKAGLTKMKTPGPSLHTVEVILVCLFVCLFLCGQALS